MIDKQRICEEWSCTVLHALLDTWGTAAYWWLLSKCPQLEVNFSPQAIEERYHRFGGIIRYILPHEERTIVEAKNQQLSVLSRTSLADVFASYRSIEKTYFNKENISDFILQYNVEYDGDRIRKNSLWR